MLSPPKFVRGRGFDDLAFVDWPNSSKLAGV